MQVLNMNVLHCKDCLSPVELGSAIKCNETLGIK